MGEAVRHIRTLHKEIRFLQTMDEDEVFTFAKEIMAPVGLVQQVKRDGKLPIVNFAAGGVATPADAALCMQLGVDGVFVGSGIFKSEFPEKRARAIVKAVTHFNDPKVLAEVSEASGDEGKGGIRPTPSLTSNTCREAQVFREVAEIGEKNWYLFFRDPEVARCHDCFPHRTASRIRVLRVSMWPRWPLRAQVQLEQFLPSVIASSQAWSVTFSFGS